jgi:hypothetical protein
MQDSGAAWQMTLSAGKRGARSCLQKSTQMDITAANAARDVFSKAIAAGCCRSFGGLAVVVLWCAR